MKVKKVLVSLMTGILMMSALAMPCVAESKMVEEKVTESSKSSLKEEETNETENTEEETAEEGLTPEGNLTLVDDVGSDTDTGKQFITLVTKDGNFFYLIIDRDEKGNENVHFLNQVDEADLMALMDEDEIAVYESEKAETQEAAAPDVLEETTEADVTSEQETLMESSETAEDVPEEENKAGSFLLPFSAAIAAATALLVLISKKKKERSGMKQPHLDDEADEIVFPDDEADEIRFPDEEMDEESDWDFLEEDFRKEKED